MLENIEVKHELNIVFMGTPEFSVPVLEGLIANYKIRAVVTQPDRAIGRDQKLMATPIKQVALKHDILVLQPEKLKDSVEEILALEPDLIITCAYGQMIPDVLLAYPKVGAINVHASLLPKLRGGAPIHHAIIDGYSVTGITIMHMAAKMDAGDIISKRQVTIEDTDTASTLHDRLKIVAKELLLDILPSIIDGTATRTKQDEIEATYAFTLKRADEHIKFDVSKKEVYNQIRGLSNWPGSYCTLDNSIIKVWGCYMTNNVFPEYFDGQVTKIYEDGFGVKVENGEVVFTVVQPEGKKKMSAVDFARGLQNKESLIGKILA